MDEVEDLVRAMVRKQFLTRQKRTVAAVHRDIAVTCRARGLPAPSQSSVERRIRALNPVEVGRRRAGPDTMQEADKSTPRHVPENGQRLSESHSCKHQGQPASR